MEENGRTEMMKAYVAFYKSIIDQDICRPAAAADGHGPGEF